MRRRLTLRVWKGSVQKQTYYRNETLNPGAGLGDDTMTWWRTRRASASRSAARTEPTVTRTAREKLA